MNTVEILVATELPVEVTASATKREVLHRAADLLEEFGWCQGQLGSRADGFFCMGGAIEDAIEGFGLTIAEMIAPIHSVLGLSRDECGHSYDIADWNDAPGRTKAEVVARLREAAEAA